MDKIFYVYVYLDPRKPGNYIYDNTKFDYEPFYVGKGKNDRLNYHLNESINRTTNIFKYRKIQNIKKENLIPIIIKLYEEVSEKCAFQKEKELIQKIGNLENGPLTNITVGGEGASGYKHTKKDNIKNIKNRTKIVYQYDINLNLIKKWNSISEASRELKIKDSNIIKCCKGELLTMNNFVWSYKEVVNEDTLLEKIKSRKRISKKIYQYDLDFNLVNVHDSIRATLRYNNLFRIPIYKSVQEAKPYKGHYFFDNYIYNIDKN